MSEVLQHGILERMRGQGSPRQLAALRIAVGLQSFYAVNSKIFDLLLAVDPQQPVSTVFPQWFDSLTVIAVPVLVPLCMVLSIAFAVGIFTRWVVPLLTAVFVVLFGFYYLGANAPAHWLYLWFPLLVFCFSDSAKVWSVDAWWRKRRAGSSNQGGTEFSAWSVESMAGWFAYIYFAAGLAKLFPVIKGLSWLNGQTSKEIIYYRYLDSPFHYLFGRPFFDYSENTIVFAALTVGALVLELFTGIMFLTARFNVLILTLLIAMHLFLYMTGVAGFTQTALVLGIAVLPSHWFKDTRSIG